jgi:hypothetical protein
MLDTIVITAAFAASLAAAVALERALLAAWFWVIDPENRD